MHTVLAILALAFFFVGLPVWMFTLMRDHFADKNRPRAVTGFGSALQEIDRLVARPSIAQQLETERPVHQVDDDEGGE